MKKVSVLVNQMDSQIGPGHPSVQLTGHSARLSTVDGVGNGLIVVIVNGEGRGAPVAW